MTLRTRLGAAFGALVLTFGIAGAGSASNQGLVGTSARTLVEQSCGIEPLDVELIIDTSGSMGDNSSNGHTRMYWAKLAATQLVQELEDSDLNVGGSGHHVGVTRFSGTTATTVQSLAGLPGDEADVDAAIAGLSADGYTPLDAGMAAGAADMNANGRAGVKHVLILISDGRPYAPGTGDQGPNGGWATTAGPRPNAAEGSAYLGSADVVISVAIGAAGGSGANLIDLGLMGLLGPDGAYHVIDGDELPGVFASIYEQIACPTPNLAAAKAVDKSTANPGDTLNYTITLANDGTGDATGVEVHDDITALLAHGTFGTCDNGCTNDADSVDWTGLSIPNGGSLDLHFSIVLDASGWADGVTHLPNTVVVAETNCAAQSDDEDCSTDTTVTIETPPSQPVITAPPSEPVITAPPSFFQSQAGVTDAPSEPNTATQGGSGTSRPADAAWLLVVALGVLLASMVVLTPAPARRRK